MPGPVNKMVNKAVMVSDPKELIVQFRDDINSYEFYFLLVFKFTFSLLETVYFPSTKFPFWWKFVEVLQVSGRTAYDHSVVVPTHSVAWAVGAADQSSVEG